MRSLLGRMSLRGQLIVAVAGVHALLMTLFVWDVTHRQHEFLLQLQAEHAMEIAQSMALSSAGWLSARDVSGLQETVEAQRSHPGITYAMFLDRQGLVLAHTNRSLLGRYVHGLPVQSQRAELRQSRTLLDITAPARMEGRLVGWVRVGFDQRGIANRTADLTRAGLWYAIAAIAMGVLLAGLLASRLTARLYAIRRVSSDVRSGHREARVPVTGADEVTQLGSDFNEMLDTLGGREAESRRAQEALRESEHRVRLLLDSTAEGIYGVNDRHECIFINRTGLHMLGYEHEEELLGRDLHTMIHHTRADGRPYPVEECLADQVMKLRHGVHVEDEVFWHHSGSSFPVKYEAYPLWQDAQVVGTVVTFSDITSALREQAERTSLESQLRQAQKMEAVGQLAGGVAHDFNNILTVILGNASLLMHSERLNNDQLEWLGQIQISSNRAAALTQRLLTFSRRQPFRCREVDLNQVVEGMHGMLNRLLGDQIDIEISLDHEPLPLWADASMLEQVLLNLAVNARDAMPKGGRFSIQAQPVELESLAGRALVHTGPMIRLTVADSGCGIPPEQVPHIFEPFFTTKDVGRGTGLGLSIVHGIIEQHQGWIEVDSAEERGTTFHIYLPRYEAATMAAQPAPAPATPVVGGLEAILLTEDDDAVRRLARSALVRVGYRVFEASNGPAGLQVWEQHRAEIRLALLDVVMPGGMSGIQLGQELHRAAPELPIIYCSGYTADDVAHHVMQDPHAEFIAKPYELGQLLALVRRMLDSR